MKCRYFCRLPLDISPVYLTRGISEKGQIHQRLSDQLQSEQQHEKGENPYRKRLCYTRNLKETGFKEKILCTDPHLQSCKRQKILFQMEFQKIRKN